MQLKNKSINRLLKTDQVRGPSHYPSLCAFTHNISAQYLRIIIQ